MTRSLSLSDKEDETKSICIPPTLMSSTTSIMYSLYIVYNQMMDCLKGIEKDDT